MDWFTRLRIVRGNGGGQSADGAAGSKAVVCAEFEMTTVFGDLRFSGRGELSCPFDCRRAKSSAMSRAALVRGGFEQAELDVLLLLPECDKIADLQTTLIAATNKKD